MNCNFIFSFIFLGLTYSIFAQHNNELYNNGAIFHIEPGAEVHVWGDVHMTKATGTLENNGLLKVQGNMYSDELFQQRGTGTTLIENSDVNTGERQFISGSFAVRGGSAQIGVDDGSFYNLEINNDQRIVYLVNTGVGSTPQYVADVRNTINFDPQSLGPTSATSIVTSNIGITGAIVYPSNGSSYNAEFGMMNSNAGLGNYINDTWHQSGGDNLSIQDNGYIIGKHRRAINASGGTYGFLLGLDPGAAISNNGTNKGFQYTHFVFGANTYDVISGYYEASSVNNTGGAVVECSGYLMDDFWGDRHGEWNFEDINNVTAGGDYEIRVWPQDPTIPWVGTSWAVTKDDSFLGSANDCGASPIGLTRSGLSDFSAFGLASGNIFVGLLPIELISINAEAIEDHIDVAWNVASEINFSHYELERSEDGQNFEFISEIQSAGNSSSILSYSYSDFNVKYFQNYYYRVKNIDNDGSFDYSPIVVANINSKENGSGEGSVTVYPNPTNGNASIGFELITDATFLMNVTNAIGQEIVKQKELNFEVGKHVVPLNSNKWAPGVYYIEINNVNTDVFITKRIIKN